MKIVLETVRDNYREYLDKSKFYTNRYMLNVLADRLQVDLLELELYIRELEENGYDK